MGLEPSWPVPPLRRPAGHRARPVARAALAVPSRLPATATWCAAGSSTSSWPTSRRRRGRAAPGHRGGGPAVDGASCAARRCKATGTTRCGRATSWSPRAPTPLRSPARQSRTRDGPRAWPSGATAARPTTTRRGSSRRSTCATATAIRCPATAGSSPSATAPINVGIGLLSTFSTSRASTPPTS